MPRPLDATSRFLSRVLRHRPGAIGLPLEAGGWAELDELVRRARAHGVPLTHELVRRVVAENDKQRFAIDPSGRKIRANQGHSIPVDLGLEALAPPAVLYHGTATRFLASIRDDGLRPGARQHVHLSADRASAVAVGRRHGVPTVLCVQAAAMHRDGHEFHRAANGVWLTAAVPPRYLAGAPDAVSTPGQPAGAASPSQSRGRR